MLVQCREPGIGDNELAKNRAIGSVYSEATLVLIPRGEQRILVSVDFVGRKKNVGGSMTEICLKPGRSGPEGNEDELLA